MKHRAILFFILCTLFFSCHEQSKERLLIDRAEALVVSNPDSAYILLDSIFVPEMLGDKQLARWCMLYGQVADKLFKEMPYVSQLKRAFEWYKKHGTLEEQAWIGLYLGRSYFEGQLYLQASEAYSEALETALKGNAYNVAGYICSYTADLYEYTGQTSEERRKYEEAAAYFEKAGNRRSYAFALRDVAKTWAFDDSSSLALGYMLRADSIVKDLGEVNGTGGIALGLGNLYQMTGEIDRAKNAYLTSLLSDTIDMAPAYLALGDMYYGIGKIDSARFFLDKANINTKNKYTPLSVLYGQYELEKADNNIEKALYYFERYDLLKDSLYDSQKQVDILDAEKRYNQLLLLDENQELRVSRLLLTCVLFVGVIFCLLVWGLYQERNRRVNIKMQKQQQALEQNESLLRQLYIELKEKEEEGSTKEEALNKYREEIIATRDEINRLRKEKFCSSAIVKKVKKLSSKVIMGNNKSLLANDDWNAIIKLLDIVYVGLPTSLKSKEYNFTRAELEICYLSFFNLEIHEEAILFNINPESVSKRRFRIRQKLGLENTPTILSDYLISRL